MILKFYNVIIEHVKLLSGFSWNNLLTAAVVGWTILDSDRIPSIGSL